MPAPGFFVYIRARREPHGLSAPRLRRRRRQGGRRFRADADAEPQSLHPVHAMRPLHEGDRRRRPNQHRGSRLRKRDRDLPGGGRPLPDVRQPDGRLPRRRDYDARLPVQEPALGQPVRRGYDLHALLERLQHERVDQGQARVGQGVPAHSHDAALQPGRQRLLDVRHRDGSGTTGSKARPASGARCSARARHSNRRPGTTSSGASAIASRKPPGRATPDRSSSSCPPTRRPRSSSC